MWLPSMLLHQRHTIPGNINAPKDLGITTAVARGACSQVCEFIDHLYLTGTDMDHLWNWANVSNALDFGFSPVYLRWYCSKLKGQIPKNTTKRWRSAKKWSPCNFKAAKRIAMKFSGLKWVVKHSCGLSRISLYTLWQVRRAATRSIKTPCYLKNA